MVDLKREEDAETLRTAAILLEKENRRLLEKNLELQAQLARLEGKTPADLQQRLALLEAQLAQRNQMLFGRSSEKRGGGADAPTTPKEEPQKGHGPRAQPKLPIVETTHELDEADRACMSCGGRLEEWAGQAEESEEIDVVERRFVVRKHLRKKYRCRCGGCVETALAPLKLKEGGRYSIDLATMVAVDKYVDHLALERQARRMERDGLVIDSQTLWDQINLLAHHLMPLKARLHEYILSQPVIGADETRWRMMSEKGKDEGPSNWQVWAIACPTAVSHTILESRSTAAASKVLGAYVGTVMVDGYEVYGSLAKLSPTMKLAHCWAHVRRKFIELETSFPRQSGEMVALIGQLYELERRTPPNAESVEARRKLRDTESRAVIRAIHAWALETEALPQSGLRRAIEYMGSCWKGLVRFLEDPRIPLDNNATERALRGPVQGRKNHYGSRSRRGTEVAALFYSLTDSALLNGVDPREYLRIATIAAIQGKQVPLPHELAARTKA